ncbi:four helix bundle protein [bacterium]|nr:four helix bundle protein [bacterium]
MRKPELNGRTKRFALTVIRLCGDMPSRQETWVLGKQLLRSGTSIGANYREAQRARSTSEFISKVHICMQESEETAYWLELLLEAGFLSNALLARVRAALMEAEELRAIFTAIGLKAANVSSGPTTKPSGTGLGT